MIVLDGRRMKTKAITHTYLADRFHFPFYYGRNLDALADLIAGMKDEVYLFYAQDVLDAMPEYGAEVIRVFYDAEKENQDFSFWTNLGESFF